MMRHDQRAPDPALREPVLGAWVLSRSTGEPSDGAERGADADGPAGSRICHPRPHASLIVQVNRLSADGTPADVELLLMGPMSRSQAIPDPPMVYSVGLDLAPGFVAPVTGEAEVPEMVDLRADLEALRPRELARLADGVLASRDPVATLAALEGWTLGLYRAARPEDMLVGRMLRSGRPLPGSERTQRRHLLRATGLGRAQLEKIARLRMALDQLLASPEQSLADLALRCGYYDQAHMARDFREMTGFPPSALAHPARQTPSD